MSDSIKMIKQLKDYLDRKENNYYNESFNYKGLRKSVPQADGSKKDLYVVSYLASISDIKYDGDATYFAYFDKDSEKLSYIIGPQSVERLEEE